MNTSTTIRLELGIDPQKFIQQVQLNNQMVEEQIAQGIERALNDLCEGDNLVQLVREATKTQILEIVNRSVSSWQTKSKIENLVSEKIGKKVEEYADKIADKVTASLNS